MARDYKHTHRRKSQGQGLGGVLPFLSGLALGLVVALVVYLGQLGPAGLPRPAPSADVQRPPQDATPEPAPAPAAVSKPRFDFYTILPEMEVKVPDWELDAAAPPATAAVTPEPPEGEAAVTVTEAEKAAYMIQVGSFRSFAEADRAKANLALLGIMTDIQPVVMNGQESWYRVRMGPYTDAAALQSARARLMQHGLDFMVLRLKDD